MNSTAPRHNHLLAALNGEDWQRWEPHLERVLMSSKMVLYEPGATMSHVYFPVTSVVSLLHVTHEGLSAEVAVVGNDGVVGMSLLMGGGSTTSRGVVQTAGMGYRMKADVIAHEMDRPGPAAFLLLRFIQSLITQLVQSAACNRHHSLEERMCRSLLCSLDRVSGNELLMPQKLMASILGVRRGGVTKAAGKLQREGLIHYARGHIHVMDRNGLEEHACECYDVVKNEQSRLLPDRVMV